MQLLLASDFEPLAYHLLITLKNSSNDHAFIVLDASGKGRRDIIISKKSDYI